MLLPAWRSLGTNVLYLKTKNLYFSSIKRHSRSVQNGIVIYVRLEHISIIYIIIQCEEIMKIKIFMLQFRSYYSKTVHVANNIGITACGYTKLQYSIHAKLEKALPVIYRDIFTIFYK